MKPALFNLGNMSTHPFLGEAMPDPIGTAFAFPVVYLQFRRSDGMSGLAREDGTALEILAINAQRPGKGQFRRFIKDAKEHYSEVRILEVWNPWLPAVLVRYGFVAAVVFPSGGGMADAFIWIKK